MPRTRQLKHDFFLNENLAEKDPMVRLLFIGLWVLADREGRLEDKPGKIKAQLFPYHNVDINALLDGLDGFVNRYEVDGDRYLEVKNFTKHQHVHYAEKQSTIPKCPVITSNHKIKPVIMPLSTSTSTSTSTKNGGRKKNGPEIDLEAFKRFWFIYPRKIARAKVLKLWTHLNPSNELAETIISAIKIQVETEYRGKEPKYIPHPTTWFNECRWEDEVPKGAKRPDIYD